MIDRVLTAVAILCLTAFLGILLVQVTRIDLAIVIAMTLGLAIWDLWHSYRGGRS